MTDDFGEGRGFIGATLSDGMLTLVDAQIGALIYVVLIVVTLLFVFRLTPGLSSISRSDRP